MLMNAYLEHITAVSCATIPLAAMYVIATLATHLLQIIHLAMVSC